MSCDINTETAVVKDVCYMSGSELSSNCTYAVIDADGDAVDLSAVSLVTHIKRRRTDPIAKALIVLKTSNNTITVGGAGNNEITWHGVHEIDQDVYYYDTLREDIPEYIQKGKFLVSGNVTRP